MFFGNKFQSLLKLTSDQDLHPNLFQDLTSVRWYQRTLHVLKHVQLYVCFIPDLSSKRLVAEHYYYFNSFFIFVQITTWLTIEE
jgi:hypothetical protein